MQVANFMKKVDDKAANKLVVRVSLQQLHLQNRIMYVFSLYNLD